MQCLAHDEKYIASSHSYYSVVAVIMYSTDTISYLYLCITWYQYGNYSLLWLAGIAILYVTPERSLSH